MPTRVQILPHDPMWFVRFESEAGNLRKALGENAQAIHHVGSTAVPGIYAKPIIDILPVVSDLQKVDQREPDMRALGYEAMGEFGIPGRRYFRRDDEDGVRTHHVHVFAAGSSEVKRHLAFRDFLRAHRDWARKYSDLKRSLVEAHPTDMDAYIDGKDAFIQAIDRMALDWRKT